MDPWYKVATPRTEVREGRSFNPDEFAIHLEQVAAGTAPDDYKPGLRHHKNGGPEFSASARRLIGVRQAEGKSLVWSGTSISKMRYIQVISAHLVGVSLVLTKVLGLVDWNVDRVC